MTSEVSRISRKGKARIRAGLLRSWQEGGTHREMRRLRGEQSTAETDRKRAAWDAKGTLLFTVEYPTGQRVEVRRSLRGRTDQFDLGDTFTGSGPHCWHQLITRRWD